MGDFAYPVVVQGFLYEGFPTGTAILAVLAVLWHLARGRKNDDDNDNEAS